MNGNELMSVVLDTTEWESSLTRIVSRWKKDASALKVSQDIPDWLERFNSCDPWQYVHIANIVLLINSNKDFGSRSFSRIMSADREAAKAYALLTAEIALDYSLSEKAWVFSIHEQMLTLGTDFLRGRASGKWAFLTWDDFARQSEDDLRTKSQGTEVVNLLHSFENEKESFCDQAIS